MMPLWHTLATSVNMYAKKAYNEIILWLRVENNSKFVRGKGQSRQYIEDFHLSHYNAKKLDKDGWEYELTFQYENDEGLENQIYDLAAEMSSEADSHNGFIECHFPTPPMQTLQQQDSPTAKENIPSSD
jgi:hypothetical protein